MRYQVSVGDEVVELEVEHHPDGGYRVRGSGGPELEVTTLGRGSGLVDLLVAGRALRVQPGECEVLLGQQRFTVRAESWLERAATRSVASNGSQSKKLLASMPGRIVRLLCEPGIAVTEGAPLVVMEAMKMQNELCAKADGVVQAVRVVAGQTVERGAVLLEFE